jgi:hypothetical protein
VLNYGATYEMGDSNGTGRLIVGYNGDAAAYEWSGSAPAADDGAQIIMDATGITIRDTGKTTGATVTNGSAFAFILKEQTLFLDAGVELVINADAGTTGIWFAGAADGGAKLMGPGALVIKDSNVTPRTLTTISGGSRGWQAVGTDSIAINRLVGNKTNIGTSSPISTATWKALGSGAVITQMAGASNELNIQAGVTVDLGGTTSAGGVIVLKGGANDRGSLALTATSKILLGAGTGTVPTAWTTPTIGGATITTTLALGDYLATASGVLVQIGGSTVGTITADSAADVTIASNSAFVP